MNDKQIEQTFNTLMQEAEILLDQKEYNKSLGKLQQIRNLLRANNKLDSIMSHELDKLHKLVVDQM